MSTIGKVLAFLNILVAIVLGVLIAMDYGRRQSWAYLVYRNDLAIKGLPLDKDELGPDGKPAVNDLGKQTLQELFGQVGGPPPGGPTQVEEVARVEQKVQGKIQEAGEDKAKQAAAYARYLVPLASTNSQREEYVACKQHLASDDRIKLLKTQLGQAFDKSVEVLHKDTRARTFPEAFDDSLRYVRGEPTRPFAQAFVKALSHEQDKMPKIFQDAFKALPPNPTPKQTQDAQLRVLQALRGGEIKPRQQLLDEAFDEAVETVRADFQAQLDNAFKEAKTGQRAATTGETKKSDPDEQRQLIARLLLALAEPLNEDEAAGQEGAKVELEQTQPFRRFLTVVGLQNGIRAINESDQKLDRIAYDLGVEMDRERGDFAAAAQDLLAIVQDRASRYEALRSLLERKKNQLALQQDLVRRREAEIKTLEAEIATARQATTAKREELKKMSQALFDLRLQLRDATAKNQELAKKIRELEEGR
jgi:hypothetical protein